MPKPPAARAVSTGTPEHSAKAVASAVSGPAFPALPSPGVVIQSFLNVATVLANNTPIRNLLDAIDPAGSTPGVSTVRLPGSPVGSTMSADGTHLFVTTAPFTWGLPVINALVPTAYSVTEIDTKTNTIVGIPVAVEGGAYGAVTSPQDQAV